MHQQCLNTNEKMPQRSLRWSRGSLVIEKRMIIKILVAVLVAIISIGANHLWSMYHHDTSRENHVKAAAEERIMAHVKKEIDRLEQNLIRLQKKIQSFQDERLTRQEERFRSQEEKLEKLEAYVDVKTAAHEERMEHVKKENDRLEENLTSLQKKTQSLQERLTSQEEIFRSQEKKLEKLQSYVDLRVNEKTTDAVEGLKEKIKHTETVLKDNLGHQQKDLTKLENNVENLKEGAKDMFIDLELQRNDESHHHYQHITVSAILFILVIILICSCLCFKPVLRAIGN